MQVKQCGRTDTWDPRSSVESLRTVRPKFFELLSSKLLFVVLVWDVGDVAIHLLSSHAVDLLSWSFSYFVHLFAVFLVL